MSRGRREQCRWVATQSDLQPMAFAVGSGGGWDGGVLAANEVCGGSRIVLSCVAYLRPGEMSTLQVRSLIAAR